MALDAGLGFAYGHAVAVKHQLAGELVQHRPGGLTRRLQRGWHVGVGGIAYLGRDVEVPLLWVAERQLVQVAPHLELHLLRLARAHRIAYVMAHVGLDRQGQVAVYARAIGTLQLAVQVEHPGKA